MFMIFIRVSLRYQVNCKCYNYGILLKWDTSMITAYRLTKLASFYSLSFQRSASRLCAVAPQPLHQLFGSSVYVHSFADDTLVFFQVILQSWGVLPHLTSIKHWSTTLLSIFPSVINFSKVINQYIMIAHACVVLQILCMAQFKFSGYWYTL